MMPTDYPIRKGLAVGGDAHAPNGKGPSTDSMKSGLKPVETTGFVHKQWVGPAGDTCPGMGGVKTPKTPM